MDEIAELKREGKLEEALEIAKGCMKSMVQVALSNSDNAMEYYVIQVAIIQHKLKAYEEEVQTIQKWLDYDIKPYRSDYRISLHKRLAKARELVAKTKGMDSKLYNDSWRNLIEVEQKEKEQNPKLARVSTGKTVMRVYFNHSKSKKSNKPRFIPLAEELASPSFVAVDFETANTQRVSACQIALVKVENGRVIDKYTTLIKPPEEYSYFEFTYLHGIDFEDTRQAPYWEEIAYKVQEFVGDLPVYAHNASFDSAVWRHLDEYYGTETLPKKFYCTYYTARRMIPGLANYKLPTVVKVCAPDYHLEHHRADSDAYACALIVYSLQQSL
ncbi:3'-5' exonuclease [Actinomyces sp. zg-332]|uniref:3'-5' exonuclease n=1 Tax=Actinomyces sp. zg-332 TaxID=2708340 RepID=UPI001E51DFAC|nr:3'-5' exonuclease [Actinomyces sp. zg-332]